MVSLDLGWFFSLRKQDFTKIPVPHHPPLRITGPSSLYILPKVQPAWLVDKIVAFWVDLCTPGRGAGQGSWWMRGIRTIEQQTERTRIEVDIRSSLRRWDQDYPQIHHELIVRYLCGAVVSVFCTSLCNGFRQRPSSRGQDSYYRR
jgi:hypothetical protein